MKSQPTVIDPEALDALANLYLVKTRYALLNEKTGLPSYNLASSGCSESCFELFRGVLHASEEPPYTEIVRIGDLGNGFELGLRVAAAIFARPFDADAGVRPLLEKEIEKWRKMLDDAREARPE